MLETRSYAALALQSFLALKSLSAAVHAGGTFVVFGVSHDIAA